VYVKFEFLTPMTVLLLSFRITYCVVCFEATSLSETLIFIPQTAWCHVQEGSKLFVHVSLHVRSVF
jgi:hypothetical protein